MFGSWTDALLAAGLTPERRAKGCSTPPPPVAFTISATALKHPDVLPSHEMDRMAEILVHTERVGYADALDAIQEGWMAFARRGDELDEKAGDFRGYIYRSAQRHIRDLRWWSAQRVQVSWDSLVDEFGDGALPIPSWDQTFDTVEARLRLASLLAGDGPGDDVLRVVDPERDALNLRDPIAQRRTPDILEGLPDGRWLRKLRAAHAAGRIPCVCWEHVREAGITPPPELAHRFPDCMGDRPGRLKRQSAPRPLSRVAEAFVGELEARTTASTLAVA